MISSVPPVQVYFDSLDIIFFTISSVNELHMRGHHVGCIIPLILPDTHRVKCAATVVCWFQLGYVWSEKWYIDLSVHLLCLYWTVIHGSRQPAVAKRGEYGKSPGWSREGILLREWDTPCIYLFNTRRIQYSLKNVLLSRILAFRCSLALMNFGTFYTHIDWYSCTTSVDNNDDNEKAMIKRPVSDHNVIM